MRFSNLVIEIGTNSTPVSLAIIFSNTFKSFYFIYLILGLKNWLHTPELRSPQLSLHLGGNCENLRALSLASYFLLPLSWELQAPWSPWTPHFLWSSRLCLHFPSMPQLGNSFHTGSWGNHRTYLTHFLFSQSLLYCLMSKVLKKVLSGIFSSFELFQVKAQQHNLGSVSPHWPEAELTSWAIALVFSCHDL